MRKKILVVDDSPSVLSMMDDILGHLDYDVTTATNGLDACSKLQAGSFSMIITDLNMPKMDGIEFSQRAKQMPNCKFVPIVMLSSEEDEKRISQAKQVGISTFLRKPIKENQIKTILKIVLGA